MTTPVYYFLITLIARNSRKVRHLVLASTLLSCGATAVHRMISFHVHNEMVHDVRYKAHDGGVGGALGGVQASIGLGGWIKALGMWLLSGR